MWYILHVATNSLDLHRCEESCCTAVASLSLIGERLKCLGLPCNRLKLRFKECGLNEDTEREIQRQQSIEGIAKVLLTFVEPDEVEEVLSTVEERCSQNFLPRRNNPHDPTKQLVSLRTLQVLNFISPHAVATMHTFIFLYYTKHNT